MLKFFYTMLALVFSMPAYATVIVSLPANGATYGTSVPFSAVSNTTTCPLGIATMGVYVDHSLYYVTGGVNLNTTLTLPVGTHLVVVQAWDFCNGATNTPMTITVNNQASVTVATPVDGATVGVTTPVAATAVTGCGKGVAAMGIYVNDALTYSVGGSSLSTQLTLAPGKQKVAVQAWDYCGGTTSTPLTLNVTGTTLTNLQASDNWNQWGELAPIYDICEALACPGVTWSMVPHQAAMTLPGGDATAFTIGGIIPYSDVLWSNPVIGQGNNKNGLKDANHQLLPTLHNFILDQYVYVTDLSVTQDLEFDINMYANGVGMEWGTQCNHLADGAWDLWDNVNGSWFSSGIPCTLNDKAWNHVVLQVQREANNDLLYQSLTVNGTTYVINKTVPPFAVPSGWWGMTVNYQMDGNYRMATNTTYVDNMNFTYW